MYITCGDHETGPNSVEPVETGYVPNNPLFSLSLDSPQVSFVVFRSLKLKKLKQWIIEDITYKKIIKNRAYYWKNKIQKWY